MIQDGLSEATSTQSRDTSLLRPSKLQQAKSPSRLPNGLNPHGFPPVLPCEDFPTQLQDVIFRRRLVHGGIVFQKFPEWLDDLSLAFRLSHINLFFGGWLTVHGPVTSRHSGVHLPPHPQDS